MSDPHSAVKRYAESLSSPNERIEALEAEVERLRKTLLGVLKSAEAYEYLNNPRNEENMDEYDYMMRPLWEQARDAVSGKEEQDA